MRKATVAVLLLSLCLSMIVFAAPISAQPPPLPHSFYGAVEVNGVPAPVGTQVEARGAGVLTGVPGNPLTVTAPGLYGGPGGFDPKLVVQGEVAEGTPIEFYLNGVRAQCAVPGGPWQDTYPFSSGVVTQLNLRVLGPTPTPTPTATDTPTVTPTATSTPTVTNTPIGWHFSGTVYQGMVGDRSHAVDGVAVSLYGAMGPSVVGTFLDSGVTGGGGLFHLFTSQSYPYYNLMETDPPGFDSVGAIAGPGGTVVSANWIQYALASEGGHPGNEFYDVPAAATPTPTATATATSTQRATATPTSTPEDTPTPTATSTVWATATPTSTPTATSTEWATATPTSTPTATSTEWATATPTLTPAVPTPPRPDTFLPLIFVGFEGPATAQSQLDVAPSWLETILTFLEEVLPPVGN